MRQEDFIAKKISRGQEEHYAIIKQTVPQEDVAVLSECAADYRASKHMN